MAYAQEQPRLPARTRNALVPQSYSELVSWAEKIADSDFVPKEYRGKPNDILICAQYANEIGLGLVEGLRSIAVINGKPSLYGDGLLALCLSSPVCEYVNETPIHDKDGKVTGYVCEAKRRGQEPKRTTFTVSDAQRARLANKPGPWQDYPQRMLQMRARGFALRDAFPDVLKGLISREEAQDYPPEKTIDLKAGPTPPFDPVTGEIEESHANANDRMKAIGAELAKVAAGTQFVGLDGKTDAERGWPYDPAKDSAAKINKALREAAAKGMDAYRGVKDELREEYVLLDEHDRNRVQATMKAIAAQAEMEG